MRDRIRLNLTRGLLVATACLVVSVAEAASDTPASPPAATTPAATAPAPATAAPTSTDREARWKADRQAFFEARLAGLHAGLQLKPDQEALWPPVESAIRGFAKLRADRWAAMKAENTSAKGDLAKGDPAKSDDALDRLRHGSERLIARGQAMKTLADAAGPLVASLDPAQKERLPRLLEGLRPRHVLGEALGGDRDGRGMRGDRMEGGRWGRHADRDGMGGDRREGGDMPMHRHYDETESDRTFR